MIDVFAILLIVGLLASVALPVRRSKVFKRNLYGMVLSRKEWALLGDIAAMKQVSQSKLVSVIVKQYLQERLADNTNVGRR